MGPMGRGARSRDEPPATVHPSGCTGSAAGVGTLDRLVKLVAQRLALGQDVAAAKFVNGGLIEDPIRERRILNSVYCALNGMGLYQETGVQFFRDQIEASKVIQRGLHQRWRAHPEELPAVHPNLVAEVRPKLDCITAQMMRQFMHMEEMPHLECAYIEELLNGQFFTKPPLRQLRELRRDAAAIALRSFCTDTA
jgi:chorismate mutase